MQVFDPSRAYNAFTAGAQLGGAMRQRETERMAAPAISAGNYGQAAEIYGQRGDVAGAAGYRQMYEQQLAQMDEQQKAEARNRTESIARLGFVLRGINTTTETGQTVEDLQGRFAVLQQNASFLNAMGIPLDDITPDTLTNQNLDMIMSQVMELDQLLKAQAPFTLSPGEARYTSGGEILAQNMKPADEPQTAVDAQGVRRYLTGPNIGQPVPGFETPRAERGGMQVGVDANGNPVITFGGPNVPSAFGTAGTSLGAKTFGTALETAETADATLALANRARNIIEGGYSSGVLAPLVGEARRFGREFGLGDPEKVADYEEFTAINNQLAAQMLKLFGGSDTERELAISIASNIGPRFDESTNKRMLNALDQVIEMQRSKPEYIAQWTRSFGSLDAIDPQTGLGFQATWDRLLQGQLPNMLGAASDTRQQAIQQLTVEEQAELEALRAELGMQ